MRNALALATLVTTLSLFGCKKQVPTDIVQKSLKNALRHAPATSSAMCGVTVSGLTNPTISNVKRNPDNTGSAHVAGTPFAKSTPAKCEGDVQFSYTYSQKTTGIRRKTTTTTWFLNHLQLTAVQTPGVAFKATDENPDDDDDDK